MDKEMSKKAPRFDRGRCSNVTLPEWREHVEAHFAYNSPDETQAVKGGDFIGCGANSTSVEEKSEGFECRIMR